ncbi:MAG: hypothetical protein EXR51_11250, partial [Dehalococcoidia bacterium]|nr:hypothetical protein [Dehalococcoidia bacterium]
QHTPPHAPPATVHPAVAHTPAPPVAPYPPPYTAPAPPPVVFEPAPPAPAVAQPAPVREVSPQAASPAVAQPAPVREAPPQAAPPAVAQPPPVVAAPPQVATPVAQPTPVAEAPPLAAPPVAVPTGPPEPAPVAEPPPAAGAPPRPAAAPPLAGAPPGAPAVGAPPVEPVTAAPASEAAPAVPDAPPLPAVARPAAPRVSSTPPAAAPVPAATPEPPPRRTASPPSGARTTVTQKDGRRLVTVLFGDVSGFTAMSEKLEPEDMKIIMDNCLKLLAGEVAKYDGTVDKFEGDLIMAVWGAPTAHEDDAERAVMAAMGMQVALHAFSARLEWQRGFTLKMRIGLNTGEVISGVVASGRSKDTTVMGDVVNTASRFEANAEPGTVMVGASTHALTKHMFEYETLEPIKVKGKVEALAVYRPIGIRSVRGQRRGVEGLASPMIGRGHAFEALTGAFDEAASTHVPQLVTITGIPGIGKSRLVDEFERYLVERGTGAGWCKGRCLPCGQDIAFHPLAEMLKGLFGIPDSDAKQAMLDRLLAGVREVMENVAGGEIASSELDEEARQICHRLGYAMGVAYPDSDLSEITPANVKDELLWAWRRFFYYWAGAAPAVIVVEDLQWGDRIVVDLLESLLDVLKDVPIMIVACARPELVEQSLSLVEGLNRKIIELEPLDAVESRELLDNLLSPNLLSPFWKERVVTAAGGVPFFLEEVLRGLVEEGRIVQSPAGWAPVQAENLPDLPVTVFATLFARMDRLPSLEKAVLQRASVVGSRFWDTALSYPALQLGREGTALLGLQAKNWVAQQTRSSFVDDREYLFTNDLVRESAYKALTKIQRVSEHRRTADWLESKVGDRTEEFTELLAYRYGQSSLQAIREDSENEDALRKAGTYGWRAAERARTQQAYSDALSRYNDAMTLFQHLIATNEQTDLQLDGLSAGELRLEIQLRRAQVKEPLGQLDSAIEDLDAVLRTALPANQIRQAATAYTQKGRVLRLQSHGAEAMECAEKAIELFKQAGDAGGQAQALLSLGEMYSDVPRLAGFEAACRQAYELAQ